VSEMTSVAGHSCFQISHCSLQLPDYAHLGRDPDGYASKDEFIRFLEDYASGIGAPVRTKSLVCVMPKITVALWTWQRHEVSFGRENVVVATGPFQAPKLVVRQAVIRLREIMSANAIAMFFIRYSLVVANSAIIHSQSHHCSPRVFAHLGARPVQSKKLGKRR
jgi:hypothetical protein